MGDSGLRDLERRWNETGSVEDGARWLAARVRVGELTAGQLEAAAHVGHAAAAAALGVEPTAPPRTAEQLRDWARGCVQAVLRVRAGLVLARLLRRHLADELVAVAMREDPWSDPPEVVDVETPAARELRLMLERWLEDPSADLDDEVEDDRVEDEWPEEVLRGVAASRRDGHEFVEVVTKLTDELGEADRLFAAIEHEVLAWALAARPQVSAPPREVLPGRAYDPKARFTVGDRLVHSRFGPGVVVIAGPREVEVEFASGLRKLVHAR